MHFLDSMLVKEYTRTSSVWERMCVLVCKCGVFGRECVYNRVTEYRERESMCVYWESNGVRVKRVWVLWERECECVCVL